MRCFRLCLLAALSASLISSQAALAAGKTDDRPNFVVVFADDLGYRDIGSFGADYPTPHLDRMAREGRRFTSFYVAQAVCSASRTALLTGCYPNRVGILGALGPSDRHGIHDDEQTIAEVLKDAGYATAAFGKWHLGHHPRFLPTRHGFDEYFGLPYSNDMWPFHPTAGARFPKLPLIEGDKIANPDVTAEVQTQLTTLYAERAVKFIDKNRSRPFFLYVPHAMPHVPIFASDKHAGKSGRGPYADVIQEIDWSVGEILKALQRNEIDERTLVVFTSDNGPWLSYGDHAGSASPLREGKGTSWEGGVRVPAVFRWPGRIPAGTSCGEMAATIDLLPTFTKLGGGKGAEARKIDGEDISSLLFDKPGATTPHDAYYFYWGRELQAVRSGRWKLHFPHEYRTVKNPGSGGRPGPQLSAKTERALFDLETDVGETKNVIADYPDVVARLEAFAERAREDLGDSATKREGKNVRPSGRLD